MLQPVGSQRVRHDWAAEQQQKTLGQVGQSRLLLSGILIYKTGKVASETNIKLCKFEVV